MYTYVYIYIYINIYPPPCLRHQWSVHNAGTNPELHSGSGSGCCCCLRDFTTNSRVTSVFLAWGS